MKIVCNQDHKTESELDRNGGNKINSRNFGERDYQQQYLSLEYEFRKLFPPILYE